MSAIAERAGVAVQTVYFVFHTKPALLTAAIDNAVMGEVDPVPPEQTLWWQEGITTLDGPRAIELFITNVSEINMRAATLDRVALAASTTGPELVDLIEYDKSLRTQGFRSYIDALAARGLLRDGSDPAEATDVLLTLAGADVFLNFTEERGWTVKRYVAGPPTRYASSCSDPRTRTLHLGADAKQDSLFSKCTDSLVMLLRVVSDPIRHAPR
jgi:AcrR family transcriptional regulator